MRSILVNGSFSWSRVLIGGALAIAFVFLTYAFFVRVYKRAVRSGLIARYSAETLA
jgi:ABC-2 type transport system permease protein